MSTIRVIYFDVPHIKSPKVQHPDAERYEIDHPKRGKLYVDAIGGRPTISEIDALLVKPSA